MLSVFFNPGENKLKRPIPGLKSAEISYRGGVKASREATIRWTCWSYDDITRLTPHFLSQSTEVLLEWGWVYDENSLRNSFLCILCFILH